MSLNRLSMMIGSVVTMVVVTTACTGTSPTVSTSPSVPAAPSNADSTPPGAGRSQRPVSPPAQSSSPTAVSQSTRPAVKLTQAAKARDLSFRVTGLKAITSTARGPGEISSAALQVNVQLTNQSKDGFDATSVLVTLVDSKGDPGDEMLGAPFQPFQGVVKSGASANSVWVFNVPKNRREPVTILVTLPTNDPVLLFRGNAPS